MSFQQIRKQLNALADASRAEISQRFFKTGRGDYEEGDQFLGIRVPVLRKLARKNRDLAVSEVKRLLRSPFHEERLLALLILVLQYQRGTEATRKSIYQLYLDHTRHINNWDLVDSSAEHIVGAYLQDKNKSPLSKLSRSKNLWERRIAMISTFHFIKRNEFTEALGISEMLLSDREDLIHKAVGWMLREIGKRHLSTEEGFLRQHYRRMPRTMLRYAIEKFPEGKRRRYLKGTL